MREIDVIDDSNTAVAALYEARASLLAHLAEPKSASALAAVLGMPRQKVNYHLRELERHGLVELVEERRKGNMTERLMRSTARSYVISPEALASLAPDPSREPDQLSASWLLAIAAQLVRDVGTLVKESGRALQHLSTFTLDTNIRFSSAQKRAEFAKDLASTVAALVAKYHDESAPDGREHHVVVAVHPSIDSSRTKRPV